MLASIIALSFSLTD
ncbi:uncharacterized protein FFNC_15686 [Fusarium fujikuroi]|nr:uncharacterized protein FFC1_14827 [Fusarium fujikuroi]SCO35387.1 uncharacterized protein FFNC_04403 [Fusarium fujikuroi]SCO54904.1 uncharacterized protein FFNC_15686 [Fusarium fujikuroi]SCV40355.1 uncharacterized protein FFFS_06301 [Fusarium fujikuroi]SCV59325.1 uncharacterized protein FFFS_13894 [Fusarium fujikuroi]